MPTNRFKRAEIAKRRQLVSDYHLRGWNQAAIASELGVAQGTICYDLKAIFKEWRESSVRDFDLARARELKRLDRVEREAWAAWERSQQPAQAATVSTTGNPGKGSQRTQKTVQDQVGDPRFLEQIQKCSAARRQILGLDLPQKISLTSPDGEETYHARVISELMKLAEQTVDGPDVITGTVIRDALGQERRPGSEGPSPARGTQCIDQGDNQRSDP